MFIYLAESKSKIKSANCAEKGCRESKVSEQTGTAAAHLIRTPETFFYFLSFFLGTMTFMIRSLSYWHCKHRARVKQCTADTPIFPFCFIQHEREKNNFWTFSTNSGHKGLICSTQLVHSVINTGKKWFCPSNIYHLQASRGRQCLVVAF